MNQTYSFTGVGNLQLFVDLTALQVAAPKQWTTGMAALLAAVEKTLQTATPVATLPVLIA
jgi:hypothetical protein